MQSSPKLSERNPKYTWEPNDLNVMAIYLPGLTNFFDAEHMVAKTDEDKLASRTAELLRFYFKDQELDFDEYWKNNFHAVIPSTHNLYHVFLQLSLCYFDTIKIPRYLEYQYQNFKGNFYAENQESFINLVEFHIYPWIKEKHPENPAPILKKINNWLDINKPLLLGNPAPLLTFVKIENDDNKRKVLDIFSNYFSNTDLIKLENLLNGKPVIGKLVFIGEVSKLFDAFKRLIEHKIISGKKRIIERWLSSFFSYKSDNKIKLNFTPVHAHQIISHKDIICQKPIPEFESWLKDKNIFIPKKK